MIISTTHLKRKYANPESPQIQTGTHGRTVATQLYGCAHSAWNYGLEETTRILKSGGKFPSAFELNRMLTVWKKTPEFAYLSEASTYNFQQKLKKLHGAWKYCVDKKRAAKNCMETKK